MADLEISGAYALSIHGACGSLQNTPTSFQAASSDLGGPGAKPEWHFWIRDPDGPRPKPLFAGFSVGKQLFGCEPRFGEGLRLEGRTLRIDLELRNEASKAAVRVRGTVRFPPPAELQKPPRSLVDLVGRVAGAPVRPYSEWRHGQARDSRCLSVALKDGQQDLVKRLRERLPAGWVAFESGGDVVVGPGTSQFDILRLARTDAINSGWDTEALVHKLRDFDRRFGITIWSAYGDSVEFDLHKKVPDPRKFAAELYAFCSDIVDQGISMERLIESLSKYQNIYLWWD